MLHIFVICVIRPPYVPCSDVIFLKMAAKYKVASKSLKNQLSKFSSKRYKYSSILEIFSNLLICVTSASTVDNSVLQPYNFCVVFARPKGKFRLCVYIFLKDCLSE